MLFTIISLGFEPRIAIESTDAGVNRLDKIIDLITTSKVSVHDLSRIRSKKSGEYFRLNMPFELGIDFGCKKYSQACEFSDKKFLILGSKKYEYMRALSDISGFDIQYHHDDTKALIKAIRNWFVNNLDLKTRLVITSFGISGQISAFTMLDTSWCATIHKMKYSMCR